jgi:hypothetical protein
MTNTPKLTYKQAKFVKAKAEGKTGVEAAMEAYDTTNYFTANAIAVENSQKPSIQQALHAEFQRQGITLERIVRPINDALDANKIVTSPTEPDKEVADHSIRLKASGMAAQFMGIGKQTETPASIHFHQHVEEKKRQYEF